MRRTILILLVCGLLLLSVPAGAYGSFYALSPGLEALRQAYKEGQAYRVSLQAELGAWPDLAEQSFAHIKALAGDLRLTVWLEDKQQDSRLTGALQKGGRPWLDFAVQDGGQQASLTLAALDSLPSTRYISSGQAPPWQTLLGDMPRLPEVPDAVEALEKLAQSALPDLLPYEKPVKAAVTIKHAGRGASQLVYDLKAPEAQAVWDTRKADWQPLLKAALERLLPLQQAEEISGSLNSLAFTRSLSIKRFLDQDGQDLGLQVTGAVETDGTARKLTLFTGQSRQGFYLSLKLPAVRGNDTLEAQIALKTQPGQWTGDWRVTQRTGKDVWTITGTLALAGEQRDGGETLSGEITLRVRRTGSQKSTADYRLTPDMEFTAGGLTGTLDFRELTGKAARRHVTLHLKVQAEDLKAPPPALAQVDLDTASPLQIKQEQERVQAALLPGLSEWVLSLPKEDRRLLLHDLGRDERTRGDSVPALPYHLIDSFIVTEETTTQEETP